MRHGVTHLLINEIRTFEYGFRPGRYVMGVDGYKIGHRSRVTTPPGGFKRGHRVTGLRFDPPMGDPLGPVGERSFSSLNHPTQTRSPAPHRPA
jgi:hypothetical protein